MLPSARPSSPGRAAPGRGGAEPAAGGPSGRRAARSLRLCHRADPAELRHIRRSVATWAEENGLTEDVLVDLQLAVGEAVANGVEHAYGNGDPGTVAVDLDIRRIDATDVVTVRVTDHGRWRPVPAVRGHRGRGLELIGRLGRRLEIAASRSGTLVYFELPLPAG